MMQKNIAPVLCVSKNPGSYGVHLYQHPSSYPRFQTRNLERPASLGGIDFWNKSNHLSGMATSAIFKFPDSSDGSFCNGIAAFYSPTMSILTDDQLDNLGYSCIPSRALCVISSTSRGDLYTHTLLECNGLEETRAIAFDGLPIGCCGVPVPSHNECNTIERHKAYRYGSLQWILSNSYPIPG